MQEKGVEALDAPVSGGQVGAEAASLSIMVGGNEAAFQRALPFSGDGKKHCVTLVNRGRTNHQSLQPDDCRHHHSGGGRSLYAGSKKPVSIWKKCGRFCWVVLRKAAFSTCMENG
jgi:hypothetical protein